MDAATEKKTVAWFDELVKMTSLLTAAHITAVVLNPSDTHSLPGRSTQRRTRDNYLYLPTVYIPSVL